LDEWRLIDAELDVMDWRAAPVEKATSAVENTAASGWPGGEEGWRAVALERENGGRSGAVESVMGAWSRWSMP
jgi:hypothetical protein